MGWPKLVHSFKVFTFFQKKRGEVKSRGQEIIRWVSAGETVIEYKERLRVRYEQLW